MSLTAEQLDELERYLGYVNAEWIDSRWGETKDEVIHLRASVLRELLALGLAELMREQAREREYDEYLRRRARP